MTTPTPPSSGSRGGRGTPSGLLVLALMPVLLLGLGALPTLLPAASPTAAAHAGIGTGLGAPPATGSGVQVLGNSSPPSGYCPGGTAAQVNSSSQRLDACATVIATSPYDQVLFYANQTGGGNASAPYAFAFSYGDGTGHNLSTWWNTTDAWTHYYGSSGTFNFTASVSDSYGSLRVAIPISVNFTAAPMVIALSSWESTNNGITTTAFGCSITGGYPYFDFQYAFGDGTYYRDNTSSSTGACGTTHTYATVALPTNETVSVDAWDPAGVSASATITVTPSYNYGGSGGAGNATSGSTVVLVNTTPTRSVWDVAVWMPGVRLNSTATLSVANNSALLRLNTTTRANTSAFTTWGLCAGVGNWTANGTLGNDTFTRSCGFNSSGSQLVRMGLMDSTYSPSANFTFYLNFSSAGSSGGSGGGGGSGSVVYGSSIALVVNSSSRLVWDATEWGPGDNLSLVATASDVNGTVTLTENGTIWAGGPNFTIWANLYHSIGPDAWNWTINGSGYATYYFARATNVTSLGWYYAFVNLKDDAYSSQAASVNFTFNLSAGGLTPGRGASGSSGGSGGGTGAYPTSVTVTVGAAPVTGGAPLTVTLSAFIDGGSAPFVVQWSLPGSSTPMNATGLMVTTTYTLSGWYPATAFVYNTTSSYGSVLVGYGSVWLYVTGNGTSGGSGGNGSGNHSGKTPIPGASAAGGLPPTAVSLTAALLVAVATGGVVGGVVGFSAGRGPVRRHPNRTDPVVKDAPR